MLKVPRPRFFTKRRNLNNETPPYFSLIDFGNDTIKVAVVEIKQGEVHVLGHGLIPAENKDVAGGRAQAAALSSIVNRVLQETEDRTEKLAGRKIVPDNVLFLLPAKTLAGKLFTVKQQRKVANQVITQREIDILWDRALRLARQQLPALPNVGSDWLPQTVTPAGLWLDNLLVNDPIGLQGAHLALSVYGVICQPAIIRGLEQLAKHLEVDIYQVVPASQSLATIVPVRDALVLDVGDSGTNCYLIRHDALVAGGRIPLGGNFFTRSISQAFKCDQPSAEALKIAFSSNALSKKDQSLVEQALYHPLKRWATAATEMLGEMLSPDFEPHLPGYLYYVGGSAVLPGLKNQFIYSLREIGFTFKRTPEITNLGEIALTGFKGEPTGFRGILFASVLSLAKTV